MLEFPEASTISRQFNEAVQGKRIVSAIANASPHGFAFYHGDPAAYGELLAGQLFGESHVYGGQVITELDDIRLGLNDGINARLLAPEAPIPGKHQLLLTFEDGFKLVCTIQMYGGIAAYHKSTPINSYLQMAMDKPFPISDAFTPEYFESLTANLKPSVSAKAFLATEQRIPGLGNGCLQDILFRAHVHPKRKLRSLSDAEMETLYREVRATISDMTAGGGRDTEKDLYGKPGGYRSILSSKTYAYPCPACGGGIVRNAYLGGNVYFCPTCQPLPA